ncbi:phytanoyl-CoA dioxygenase family protein [Photobacterium sp. MCCC 1A19761]|uniref:phytanoyl-CoA dioxygenase family protein n=1 Tax=Photobacterium sp. MCCC 1A19761 TaxID=3115000 RepID=UPI00307DBAD7
MQSLNTIAPSTALGLDGVPHIKRVWSASQAILNGKKIDRPGEELWDRAVFDALGIGLHQTLNFLYANAPTFSEFEAWIMATAGKPEPLRVDRLRSTFLGTQQTAEVSEWLQMIEDMPPVFTDDDLSFWDENGYLILRNAVSPTDCCEAKEAILTHLNVSEDDPDTWYQARNQHGIMVELIQHPAFETNRRSLRIHKAFSQLWKTSDLWVSADRCGFHPPQNEKHAFPGPDLHWDFNFNQPLVFGTQGILYLTDTPPEQGALTLVPGFHQRLSGWLADLPAGTDPQKEDLHALGSIPIGAKAGDMVIWNHLLPHGSRPNLGQRARIVQYINMIPCQFNPY